VDTLGYGGHSWAASRGALQQFGADLLQGLCRDRSYVLLTRPMPILRAGTRGWQHITPHARFRTELVKVKARRPSPYHSNVRHELRRVGGRQKGVASASGATRPISATQWFLRIESWKAVIQVAAVHPCQIKYRGFACQMTSLCTEHSAALCSRWQDWELPRRLQKKKEQ